ncbi:YwdI family protein [Priestia koreensis]|uniref:YwdI family protein n=1 Tax=Priestia koreensis TaxID=284581 RepID=A0A0M0KFZ0_9BACI|nr:YwdI family protein [Priestia koreensis]KOO37333.1 hypothetical protein AMD01_22970 [Priestia koreensis]
MSISMFQLIERMEQEIGKAKAYASSESKTRDSLIAIKTLCELALDDDTSPRHANSAPVTAPVNPSPAIQPSPATFVQQNPIASRPMKTDEANGDSLFDF